MMKFILDIVSTPAILVALIAILGLVLQKKKLPDIIKGGIKTFVGFLVVSGGAGIVQNSLNPFGTMFEHAFHLSGVVPNNEAIVAVALTTYGSATAMIMFAGMVFNILIARFTRFKYIFLTGHHTLYMAYDCGHFISCWFYKFASYLTRRISTRYYYEYFPSICTKIYDSINWK